jgi:hypothetical protein
VLPPESLFGSAEAGTTSHWNSSLGLSRRKDNNSPPVRWLALTSPWDATSGGLELSIHYEFDLRSDDAVEVWLDKQANVRMLDESNFQRFLSRQEHICYGLLATASPVLLRPPNAGHWHVVIDLGGYAGTVSASAYVV